ncbi:MAG: hypothetical protein M0Q95_08685 [Porticoccaceae bacterium]|nr:hypothetical protein [Porticoccaceae bacterium]
MTDSSLIATVKAALPLIPEIVAHSSTVPPPIEDIYLAKGHEKALNLEATLVVGDRGSGKSFWSAALNGEQTRKLIGQQFPRLRLDQCTVSWGYAAERGHPDYPSRQVLEQLVARGSNAEWIWRTVILHQLLPKIGEQLPMESWQERVEFVANNVEKEEAWLTAINAALRTSGERHLIVFDALDRLGNDWSTIRSLVKGLLRVCLDARFLSNIHTKLFMRPDMWEDQSIWAFPDASKLQHNRVVLEWTRVDLYGLLWHWLANHPSDADNGFRNWCRSHHNHDFVKLSNSSQSIWLVPASLESNEEKQAEVLSAIASPYMGTNSRRGKTYTWLPTHLADARGRVTPRSFLLAIKHAQQESESGNYSEPLHYEGIKKGVAHASRVRLQELKEDYFWIDEVIGALKGLTVPTSAEELIQRWRDSQAIEKIEARVAQDNTDESTFLPPHTLESRQTQVQKEEALIAALIEIGVMSRLPDNRLNIPDLFRVAAGIKRRGGVKAVR